MRYLVFFFFLISFGLQAQKDSIFFNNKDVMVGELKSYNTGTLIFKTPYSDKDFKIKFEKISGIYLHKKCIVTLTRGRRRFGFVRTLKPGYASISSSKELVEVFKLSELIAFQEINDDRSKRFKASIDMGYDFTKAQNKRQVTVNGTLGYVGEFWVTNANINLLDSKQDDVNDIQRADIKADVRRLLSKTWYLIGEITYLSNTEQALEGRYTPNLGAGKLLLSTPKLYLGISTGVAYNFETYVDNSLDKQSAEAFLASTYNMYNFDDISLITNLKISPTISTWGRVRADYDITLKYDLPYDFYIKTSFTLNYDNKPAIEGNHFDYIFSSGLGWEFNK